MPVALPWVAGFYLQNTTIMSKLGFAGWVLAAILFAVLVLQRNCSGNLSKKDKTKNVQTIKIDTFFHDTGSTHWLPIEIKGKPEIMPGNTVYLKPTHEDTLAILKNYFALRVYKDTVKANNGKVQEVITDSVKQNKLVSQTVKGTIKDSIKPDTQKLKMYIGVNAGFGIDLKTAIIAPTIGITTKKDAYYSIGYDFINKMPIVGIGWKVHF